MKKNLLLSKFLLAVLMVTLFSSCTRDLLVSKREIRNMDLVKVGAPDREIPEVTAPDGKSRQFVQESTPVADHTGDLTEDAGTSAESDQTVAPDNSSSETAIAITLPLEKIKAKKIKRAATAAREHTLKFVPAEKATKTVMDKIQKGKKPVKPGINLIRLILYIVVVLLVIAILQLILPGNLVYIVILVLLLAGLLYFLGEI